MIETVDSSKRSAEDLAAESISLFGTGIAGSLETAYEAIAEDSSSHFGWTALAIVNMNQDTTYMDSIFSKAFSLTSDEDPVLREAYAYWLLTSGDPEGAMEHSRIALSADSAFSPAWLTLSMALSDLQLYDQALQVSEMSLEKQPNSIQLFHQYASALDAAGLTDEAIEAYEEVIRLDSLRVSAYADLGFLYENTKRDGEAVKTYRRLLEIAPDYSWAWSELAAILQAKGRPDLADSFFSRSVELDPEDSWAMYRLGKMRASSDPASAVDLLRAAVEISPENSAAWQELVFLYESAGEMVLAEAALEKCIELAPEAWLCGELGWVRESMYLYPEAAEAYESGIALDPGYLYGWQRRGDLYIIADDLVSAEAWFREALDSLDTPDQWILQRLGTVLVAGSAPGSAVTFFQQSLELDPTNHGVWLSLARAWHAIGEFKPALESLDSCVSRGGDTISVFADRIMILEAEGRTEQADSLESEMLESMTYGWIEAGWGYLDGYYTDMALNCALRALEYDPADPWDVISLGELFGRLDRSDLQLLCFRTAAESPLRNSEHVVSIANYFFQRGMYEESIELLLEEYSASPWNPDVATSLAEAYLFDDQLDMAEELLDQVVQDDPYSVYAICYLGLIEENRGNPESAAERYLEALRIETGYQYAEDRLRFISGEDYDPARRRRKNRPLVWSLWLDLSSTGGNVEEQNFGGGGSIALNYGRHGSSVVLETRGSAEIKNGTDLRRTAWASISSEHFLSRHLYAGASSSWDRQPLTVRPWQVSSYLAAGWKSWPASWIWLAPETGAGLVTTRWSTSMERTDEWTVYSSMSIWAKTAVNWLPSLWLSGNVYLPPRDLSGLVANAVGELEFSLPGPLSLIIGSSLDYTKTPVVESWKKLDSEFYLRLRL